MMNINPFWGIKKVL